MNSELRQDLVSGDWIVIAPRRAKKHLQYLGKEKRIKAPIKDCPFEEPQKTGHSTPILVYPEPAINNQYSKWEVMVVENKYPVFTHKNICAKNFKKGPYSVITGIGHHDLIITRDHHKNFPHLNKKTANLVFQAFRDRYLTLLNDSCLGYISVFHNWGPKAGATIYHPHYQIIALPVVPPDVEHSLGGSTRYFKKFKRCVHCEMIGYEKKNNKRIIYENQGAIVFTPFISREPFELRVFPKKHLPYFENTLDEDLAWMVEALQVGLQKIERKLKDPDYNFFIHTAPLKDKNKYKNYHWHIEIQPKISISAGFELGTGIEITVVDPDEAAKILR
jgi:UDPglucose--hexose-1-phosphate uridylyltransferase